jgi:hypothetical protein
MRSATIKAREALKDKDTIVVLYESKWHSFVNDAMSLGWLIALLYANHVWGDGNWVVNALGALLAGALLVKWSDTMEGVRFTKAELRAWARSEEN